MLNNSINTFLSSDKNAVLQLSQKKPASGVRAIKSEVLYDEVKNRAASIGMRVNSKKTQILCIAPRELVMSQHSLSHGPTERSGLALNLIYWASISGRALMLTHTLPR